MPSPMMTSGAQNARALLQGIAHRVMLSRGLAPDFSAEALAELARIDQPATDGKALDLRHLAWCSIDNDDSRDLDQLSMAESLPGGACRLLVAIADVTALVPNGSALDTHARQNTTSVYTAAAIFPMLPEKLSNDLTSLNYPEVRLAMVTDMTFAASGELTASSIYQAQVRNQAKLAYNSTAAWLDGTGSRPPAMAAVPGLGDNIRLQYQLACKLAEQRHRHGALSLETLQARSVFAGDLLTGLEADTPNSAKRLIEDLMIAANGVAARFLAERRYPSIRRVVRTPAHWDLIVDLAEEYGERLPSQPDAVALEQFLVAAKSARPAQFPDLSLSVIKLMGAGEYVLEAPGAKAAGHFGLAVKDYAHSTAPNRRYPDVITQRLLKSALANQPPPYSLDELADLARHCTEQENAAKKVERQVGKSAAALLLGHSIGRQFEASVTGAAQKGTWVRINQPPVEGRLNNPPDGLRVGDRLRVRLVHTDVERGHIDFRASG